MTRGLAVNTVCLLALSLGACSSQPCHRLKRPELAQSASGVTQSAVASAEPAAVPKSTIGGPVPSSATSPASSAAVDGRVLVAKPDGSLQCGMNPGVSVTEMEKQLGTIKVYKRERLPDGKMHIQVCGSATGFLNVYEIPASSMKEAEKRGFKRFEN